MKKPKLPEPYFSRLPDLQQWRNSFGDDFKLADQVLCMFCDAFMFSEEERYKFEPNDTVMAIYRAVYPSQWTPDTLEQPILIDVLEKEFKLTFEDATLEKMASFREIVAEIKYAQHRRDLRGNKDESVMRSRISRSRYVLLFLLPSLITIGWVASVLNGLPAIVAFFGVIVVLLAWYGYLTIPFEFELKSDNTIEFSAVLRKTTVPVSDVREIDARPWNRGLVIFRLPHTTISAFRALPELRNLIEKVKNDNPSVKIKGSL